MLQVQELDAYYRDFKALDGVTLEVAAGELVCLLGGNASGKSTTLKAILGLVELRRGRVVLDGDDLTDRPATYRVRQGIAIVPEGRRLFAPMTVLDNLELGASALGTRRQPNDLESVYEIFPLLHERRSQIVGTLSGGEQQMVAIGRALMSRPSVLLLDEPTMGLAPSLVEVTLGVVRRVHQSGVAVLIVEQKAELALAIADRGYVLQSGRIVLEGRASLLLRNEALADAYFARPRPTSTS